MSKHQTERNLEKLSVIYRPWCDVLSSILFDSTVLCLILSLCYHINKLNSLQQSINQYKTWCTTICAIQSEREKEKSWKKENVRQPAIIPRKLYELNIDKNHNFPGDGGESVLRSSRCLELSVLLWAMSLAVGWTSKLPMALPISSFSLSRPSHLSCIKWVWCWNPPLTAHAHM